MPYLGSSPARGLVGTADIDAVAVTTAKIATNAIDGTLTKDALIGDYSDVTITAADLVMYGDATDSNNTKRDTVQGILDLSTSGWEFVEKQTASADSSIDFVASIEAGYDYQMNAAQCMMANDGVHIDLLVGVAGPTYRTASYLSRVTHIKEVTAVLNNNSTTSFRISGSALGNATNEFFNFQISILDPANASIETSVIGMMQYHFTDGVNGVTFLSGRQDADEAHVALRIIPSAGNIASGVFSLSRRKNA